jgi:hypothetical protein
MMCMCDCARLFARMLAILPALKLSKVVLLRDVHGLTFPSIAAQVVNLRGEHPPRTTVEGYYKAFSRKAGRHKTKYANCGRKAWKLTKEMQNFVIKRLKQLRRETVGLVYCSMCVPA